MKMSKYGFSLIELMIVIAIISILVGVALPQFASMTEDAKRSKAKNDIQTIVSAIHKFMNLEKTRLTNISQLKGKYIANLDTLKDPWGKPYAIDITNGIVLSFGPDGKHSLKCDSTWNDDIYLPYIGLLTLVSAKLAINPENLPDDEAYDILVLKFNRTLSIQSSSEIELDFSSNTAATLDLRENSSIDNDAKNGKIFRWYKKTARNFINESPLKINYIAKCKIVDPGDELYCKFPNGSFGQLTTEYLINITGTKQTPNPFFKGEGGVVAEAAGSPCKIEKYDGFPPDFDKLNEYQSKKLPVMIMLQ